MTHFDDLRRLADLPPVSAHTPPDWFSLALSSADAARAAERAADKDAMFVQYSRSAGAYVRMKQHEAFPTVKLRDPAWAARVAELGKTQSLYISRAKELKEQLKQQYAPSTSASASAPTALLGADEPVDSQRGGSIADRMRALGGKGMDVGTAPHAHSRRPSLSVTGGAGTLGVARRAPDGGEAGAAQNGHAGEGLRGVAREAGRDDARQASNCATTPAAPCANATPPAPTASMSTFPAPAQVPSTPRSTSRRPAGGREQPKSTPPSGLAQSPHDHDLAGQLRRDSPSPTPHGVDDDLLARFRQLSAQYTPDAPLAPSPASPAHPHLEPSTPAHPMGSNGPAPPSSPDDLAKFASAFPSLSEFGKQFDEPLPLQRFEHQPPSPAANGHGSADGGAGEIDGLPSFPSIPNARPGLPSPPAKPDFLRDHTHKDHLDAKALSPPSADLSDIRRPASTPNVNLIETDLLSSPPPPAPKQSLQPHSRVPQAASPLHHMSAPPAPAFPTAPPSTSLAMTHPADRPHSPLVFPTAKPAAAPAGGSGPSSVPTGSAEPKPHFPITSAIAPQQLREYFLSLNVEMLLLDVRYEDEYKRGYVGQEYEARGAKVNVVWLDPTVVLRAGMTSAKLEDSLSVSSDVQKRLFENRNNYDLVVLYDARSTSFSRPDAPGGASGASAAVSRLSDMVWGNEYSKMLPRCPVLLVGGYEAWFNFIAERQKRHQGQHRAHVAQRASLANGTAIQRADARHATSRRDTVVYQPAHYAKDITDKLQYGVPQSMTGESSYTGRHPSAPKHGSLVSPSYSTSPSTIAPLPPAAPIHPGPGARRRSDYVEAHNQAYSGYSPRPIDYPQAHALSPAPSASAGRPPHAHTHQTSVGQIMVPRPPPAAAPHQLDRHESRRQSVMRSASARFEALEDGAKYWADAKLGLTGLKNLGNTCYMNSTIQCLSATFPFARYFLDGRYKRDINVYNNLGTKGNLANAFAELLKALWEESYTFISPITFRKNIIAFKSDFAGSEQHDSQEFLSFVMDGLHEDLNRIRVKPAPVEMTPEREAALESLPPQVASDKEWAIYKMRNDSFIVDLFQGQYMNRMECLVCHKTSTVYDSFQWLTLDLPTSKQKVVLPELFDQFVKPEILDGDEKWYCPRCKTHRRASKTLTLVRLPPVLLIQLKRFLPVQGGRFWNKADTPVIFPLKALDLTRYVPARQATGAEDLNDPRTQVGPFRYDLYGVSNHMGTLSSGHYTAYVKSADRWMFCEDSRVLPATEQDVVSRPAYILFYKRVRA
ncbi:ubiquitin-specific protease doa4 [Cryptotrichosporon argae]